MRLRTLCFSIVLSLTISCNESENSNTQKLKRLSLSEVEEISLLLDKETTSNNPYYQLIETDSMVLLAFFNQLNGRLYFYDLDSHSLNTSILFDKNGPNGIGERVTSFRVISGDSILLHSYNKRKLLFMNWEGESLGDLQLFNEDFNIAPQTSMGAGPIRSDSWFYLYSGNSCIKLSDFQPASIVRVNSLGVGIEEVMDYPDAYLVKNKGYWPRKLCNIFSAYNSDEKLLIYSFPLDPKIKVVRESGGIEELDMSLPNFKTQESLSPGEYPNDPFAEFKAFLGYSRFANIYYDPYRKVYLRSFYKATSKEMLEENKLVSEKSMIVSNDKFEILGELDFRGTENLLFGKKGIYQILFDTRVEDTLRVKRFEYAF